MKEYSKSLTRLSIESNNNKSSSSSTSNKQQNDYILVEKFHSQESLNNYVSLNLKKSSLIITDDHKQSNENNFLKYDKKIFLNISGRLFITYENTLNHFPNTLLGDSITRLKFYDSRLNEYFFDRHSSSFESILYYYQSRGLKLYRPKDVPIDIFLSELEYFGIDKMAIFELMQRENIHLLKFTPDNDDQLPSNKLMKNIWSFFEYPTSVIARFVSIFSSFLIILSIICAGLETIYDNEKKSNNSSQTMTDYLINLNSPLIYLETFCNLWFLIEFTLRFISCPSKFTFIRNILNLLDLFVAIVYFSIIIMISNQIDSYSGPRALIVLRILKLLRIIRIFKLTKYAKLLQVLVLTLRSSIHAIIILLLTLLMGVVLFAFMIYYAESTNDPISTDFNNIIDGIWYSVNVMTTVGDSSLKPKTILGKMIGSCCAIVGILLIAVPIPVIVSNFTRFYQVLIENSYNINFKITI